MYSSPSLTLLEIPWSLIFLGYERHALASMLFSFLLLCVVFTCMVTCLASSPASFRSSPGCHLFWPLPWSPSMNFQAFSVMLYFFLCLIIIKCITYNLLISFVFSLSPLMSLPFSLTSFKLHEDRVFCFLFFFLFSFPRFTLLWS